jgi:hypothetical protein
MNNESHQASTSAPPADRRHIFIISYGRTGSTLLMALLSNHPGVLVRGENGMVMRQFENVFETLLAKHDPDAVHTSNAYYGAHRFSESHLTTLLREFTEAFLAGDKSLEGISVLGFKEANYDCVVLDDNGEARRYDNADISFVEKVIRKDLCFLRRLFPNCLFVFNTRDPADVVRSDFQTGRDARRIESLSALYCKLAREFDGVVADYSDIVEFGPQCELVFKRLGVKPDIRIVQQTLASQQGYVTIAPGSIVSRVPYFLRPLPREDISFLDIQSLTLFDSRIAVVSGGLICGAPIERGDWSTSHPQATVVRFKGGNPTNYYAEYIGDPSFANCGFAFEVILPKEVSSITVSLFGRPAWRIDHIGALPETPV